jgi:hypothetical protein
MSTICGTVVRVAGRSFRATEAQERTATMQREVRASASSVPEGLRNASDRGIMVRII